MSFHPSDILPWHVFAPCPQPAHELTRTPAPGAASSKWLHGKLHFQDLPDVDFALGAVELQIMQVDPATHGVVHTLCVAVRGFAVRCGESGRWQLPHFISATAPHLPPDLDERLTLDDA